VNSDVRVLNSIGSHFFRSDEGVIENTSRFETATITFTVQSEAYCAWKCHSPAGTARIAQAFKGGELVGSASAVPVRFTGGPSDVWQPCDLAIAPNLRARGILTSCLKRLLSDIGSDAPVYCPPNGLSRSPLLRAGSAEVGRLRLYVMLRPFLHRLAQSDLVFGWSEHRKGQASQVRASTFSMPPR
jgi:hypothetical protein